MSRIGILLFVALSASVASAADLTVSAAPDSNITFVNGGYEPVGAGPGNISTATLGAALAFGPATLRASGDVTFENAFNWPSTNGLRVEAGGHVILHGSITNVTGAPVRLRADSGGTGIGTIQAGAFNVTAGSVEAFYNPAVFPIPTVLWSGGTTPTAYMLVNTRTTLQAMSTNLTANYALGRDIDAAGPTFTPVGDSVTPFSGRFEGNGHTIRNLDVALAGGDYGGLFGSSSNAILRNVRIVDATVSAANQAGILLGAGSNTIVDRVFTTGIVTVTNSTAGGIAGTFHGSLFQSASTAAVSASTTAGGLVGQLTSGAAVSDAYATGPVVAATLTAGGLVGAANGATIDNAYSAGAVFAAGNAGGLAGIASGTTFSNCYWDTQASGQAISAGGTGRTTAQMKQQSTFIGWSFGTIWSIIGGKTYPYLAAIAPVPATGELVISTQATSNVTLSNGVFQATASPAVLNVTDLTTALASSSVIVRGPSSGAGDLAILAPISWGSSSRLGIEARGDLIVAASVAGSGILQLRSELGTIVGPGTTSSASTEFLYNPVAFPTATSFSSFGTVAGFMLIHNRTQLEAVAGNCSGTYALASDLDLGGTAFLPLCTGAPPFTGTFSGDFHTIRGLTINRPTTDGVGVFGATQNARIRDLRIENASVTGRSSVGILIGHVLDGSTFVDRVLVSGTVTALGSAAGGLVGQSDGSGFSEVASHASVTSTGAGQQHFGGVFGLANPSGFDPVTFTDSYATGAVNGGTNSAVGGHGGTTNMATGVFTSYSAGAVTGASLLGGLLGNGGGSEWQDYWNSETSGQASAGFNVTATALTSSQMRTAGSFAPWDFSNVWNIFDSIIFPFLRIEDKAVISAPPSVVAGTQLTYTFAAAASKQSYENVIPVAFAHAIPAGTTLLSSSLPAPMNVVPGWSGTYDVTVAVAPSTTGTLPIDGTFTTPTFAGLMNATVAVTTSANLSVAVSAAPDPVPAGGTLTYTVTVANAGPSDAADVVVSHALPPSLSLVGCTAGCVATSIAAGASAVFAVTASVPASLASGTTLSATTSVTSSTSDPDPADNSVVTTVSSSITADLAIGATASAAEAGSTMTWTVTVTNTGPSDAGNVNVTHTLAGVTCSSSCAATTLAAGASVVFTLDEIVPASTPAGTTLSGTFIVSSATTDPNAANDSVEPSAIVTTSADLAVTNVVATTSSAGDPVTWTVTVTNNGPSDAANVTVSYGTPVQVSGVTCSGSCAASSIAAGASVAFTITGIIDPATAAGTVVSLTATALATTSDPNAANDSASSNFAVATLSAIAVAITDAPDPVAPNGSITYTITVTSAGPSVATNVPLTIALAPGVSATLPPATIASLPVGTQTYIVDASVDAPFGSSLTTTVAAGTATASATTIVASPSSLTVTKSVDGTSFALAAPVTYTITITNNGTSAQFDNPGDEMTDVLPASLTLRTATATAGAVTTVGNEVRWNGALAPAASVTITIHATVAVPGPITNEATIRFDADGNGTNESTVVSNAVTITAAPLRTIPSASTWALMAMITALALAGWLRS